MRSIGEKIDLTVQWLREQTAAAKAKGLIVGVSGGIDSALCAFLLHQAFPDDSLGVILPCRSNPRDREDALAVINACGMRHLEVDLTRVHGDLMHAALDALPAEMAPQSGVPRMTDANLRARLRMSTLYFFAGLFGYLVVGTDNAAEVYTGYFTKYGDGGVDLLPLARLKKQEVREWSAYMGVPAPVISKAPTAGLWDGQTDEGEMGTTYAMIDALLTGQEIPAEHRQIIERLHRASEHKRQTPSVPPAF